MNKDSDFFVSLLQEIYPCKTPFSLKLIHKSPKTRLGSYSSGSCRIRIYDGSRDTLQCTETAIHEYAHHLHYTEFKKRERKQKPHGREFWQIYGQLVLRAKQLELFSAEELPVIDFPHKASL